jgi:molybdopterin-guanine dinucleotide biosynthesis protein A
MSSSASHNARILGVILAGGASRRLGGNDKYLLSLGGKKILSHIIERFEPQVSTLILNAQDTGIECSLEVVPDTILDPQGNPYGPLGGLFTAIEYAKQKGYEAVVTVPCDTPFIPHDFVERLSKHNNASIVVANSNGRMHPVLAKWDLSLAGDLRAALKKDQRKMMAWVNKHNPVEVIWNQSPDPFLNINTAEDLTEARKLF